MQRNINLKQFHTLIFIHKLIVYLLILKYLNRIIKIIQPDGTFKNIDSENMFGSLAYLNSDNTRMLRFRDGMIHTFDSSGRLMSIEDTNNNKVTLTRQSGGLITSIKEPAGKALNFTYDANSRITSIQDPIGKIVSYTYNSQGTLWKVTDLAGGVTTYTYDTQNRLQTITDARGIKFLQNIYDAYGRVSKQTMPDGGEYNLYYFSASTPVRVDQYIVPSMYCGGRTMTVFAREGDGPIDSSGACSTVYVNVPSSRAVPEGSSAVYAINQTIVVNPDGSSITHRFDGQGYPLSVTDGIGGQISYERETGTHLLKSVTDKMGRKTLYAHDANGNVISITDPAGNVTSYEYDPVFNKPTKITDAIGNVTAMTYDSKGNLISITDPMGKTTTIAYNATGQPKSITDALGNTTTFEYDSYGNLIKAIDPLGNSAQMQYDFIGRLIEAIDAKGKSTQYVYDLMNRITEITDALNGTTRFTYDGNGNMLTVTDAKNQTISYTYSVWDKVATMTDQLGKVENYSYDKMNNLVSLKDRKGQLTKYTYDFLSRPVNGQYADGSKINYSYDAGGRLTTIDDTASGMISLSYDNLDRLIQEITSLGAISYVYNAIGSRTSMTVAGQPTVNYNYDANSRLTGLVIASEAWQSLSFGFAYDAIGRRTTLSLPNGITTSYSYNNASRLLNLKHLNSLNQILESLSYVYDANGNRTKMDRQNVSVKLPQPASNITYNSANQMLTFNGKNMTYDANGNIETITNSCGTTTYTWDVRNRLVGINGFTSTCTSLSASFKYYALGRRIEKSINSKTTQYLYDGLDIVQEIENGTVTVNYIRTLNIDEPLAMINQDGVYYYIYDGLGSVIGLADQFGNDVVQYYYDPFGNTTTNNPSFKNPFQYTGRENDNTGLYAYRPRYYSPELQRFTSEDPIGWIDDINQFAYTGNNPINFVDPLGLFLLSIRYSNNPYGSITVVWNSWLPHSYRSGTRGDNGTEIESGIYKYKYGTHPIAGGYPALNLYSRSGSRTLSATRTDNKGNTAAGINFHRGNSLKSSKIGSKGCHVIPKGNYEDFIDQFEKGDEGYYIYIRLR